MNRKNLETEIRAIITRVTEEDAFRVGLDENLADATGLDSLGRLELLSEMEEKFDFTIYDLDTDKISTIGGMLQIVEKAMLEVV
ncbi:MAG: acyl carrier protein [Silicimonas sp.]|nr:acyl carrier protein [Silicimonas sp.]